MSTVKTGATEGGKAKLSLKSRATSKSIFKSKQTQEETVERAFKVANKRTRIFESKYVK